MKHQQLELEFVAAPLPEQGAQVVELRAFAQAREARKVQQLQHEQASLIAAIVKSVEHITGRSPDAEAM